MLPLFDACCLTSTLTTKHPSYKIHKLIELNHNNFTATCDLARTLQAHSYQALFVARVNLPRMYRATGVAV
jgi:hypothetical protein